jgi:hypothetical protein
MSGPVHFATVARHILTTLRPEGTPMPDLPVDFSGLRPGDRVAFTADNGDGAGIVDVTGVVVRVENPTTLVLAPDPAAAVVEVAAPCCEPTDAQHMVGATGHSVWCRTLATAERREAVEHAAARSRTDDEQTALGSRLTDVDRGRITNAVAEAWAKGLAQGRAGAARDIRRFEAAAPGGHHIRGALLEAAHIAENGWSDPDAEPDTPQSLARFLDRGPASDPQLEAWRQHALAEMRAGRWPAPMSTATEGERE